MVDHSLQVGSEFLAQVKKYLRVLVMSESKREHDNEKKIGSPSVEMQVLY